MSSVLRKSRQLFSILQDIDAQLSYRAIEKFKDEDEDGGYWATPAFFESLNRCPGRSNKYEITTISPWYDGSWGSDASAAASTDDDDDDA